ncbi:MAG: SDR family NAD(P)-dependent oxidoreductase [Dehalococcoidia bacterium]
MYKDLKNKKIIVTGIATGIGKSITTRLSAYGSKIAALDIDKENGSNTVFNAIECGGDIKFFYTDVQNESNVKKSIKDSIAWLNGVDVLIHTAGILDGANVEISDFSESTWDEVIGVNLKGSFLITKYVSKFMIKQKYGAIILTASGAGVHGGSSSYAYGSSKGGVHGLSLVLEQNLSKYGIRVNDVLPGSVKTPLKIKNVKDTHKNDDKLSINQRINELVSPDDIAKVYAFLASEEASMIRGSIRTR